MNLSDERSRDSSAHSSQPLPSNHHQQQKRQRQPQNKNSTKIQITGGNEYIGMLNIIADLSREVIYGNNNFSSADKELIEEDMKKRIISLAGPLAANMQLPNGKSPPVDSLLSEPENQELLKEEREWKTKSRDALRRNIKERKELVEEINPLIQKAIDIEASRVTQGTFDDPFDDELGDSLSLDPKLQQTMKKEFNDSMELLMNIQKETPQRLAQYAEIERIMDLENSTPSSPQ